MSVESSAYLDALVAAGVTSAWMLGDNGAGGLDLTDAIGSNNLTKTSGTETLSTSTAIAGQTKSCVLNGSTWFNKATPGLDFTGDFTIGGWFNYTTVDTGWPFVANADVSQEYAGWQVRDGNIAIRAEGDVENIGRQSNTAAATDTWVFAVFTHSAAGDFIYIDGEDDTDLASEEGTASTGSAPYITIGARDVSGTANFTGKVQGLFIDGTKALSAEQVGGLFAAGSGGPYYNLMRRGTLTGADTLIATLPADVLSYTLTGLAADSVGYYWVRAFSACGVGDTDPVAGRLRRVAMDGSAALIAPAPNAPYNLRLVQGPGGLVTARWAYRDAGAEAPAVKFNVYYATDATPISYTAPDFTVNTVAQDNSQALGTFAGTTAVKCVVRAMAEDEVEETNTTTATGTADASAPAVPTSITVTAEAD